MPALTLHLLSGDFAICRLPPGADVPDWTHSGAFSAVVRTADELSIICPAALVPAGITCQPGWRMLKFQGPFAFSATGVLASVLEPLARAQIGILATSTFDTDYVLVPEAQLDAAKTALTAAGHAVR